MTDIALHSYVLKGLGISVLAVAVASMSYIVAADANAVVSRAWVRYVAYLENRLRCQFIRGAGVKIAAAQVLFALGVVALAMLTVQSLYYALLVFVLIGPKVVIDRMQRARTLEIERKLDGFLVTFVNALKATPSIGNALSYAQPLLGPPLEDEIALVLKELRVGTSLEQALLNMSTRVQSAELDAVVATILIGRQVGGNLPRILETAAATLREMTRLQGVVRAKTAEGKVQLFVVALTPIALVGCFHLQNPAFFDPLVAHPLGMPILVASALLWCVALMLARRIISVNL